MRMKGMTYLFALALAISVAGAASESIDTGASESAFSSDLAGLSLTAQRNIDGEQFRNDFVQFQAKMASVLTHVSNWTILRNTNDPQSAPDFDASELPALSQMLAKPRAMFDAVDGVCSGCPAITLSQTARDSFDHHRWAALGFIDFLTNWLSDKGYRLAAQLADELRANCSSGDLVTVYNETFSNSVLIFSAVHLNGTCDACGVLYNKTAYVKLFNCFYKVGQLRMLSQRVCAMVNDAIPANAYPVTGVDEIEQKFQLANEKMQSFCKSAPPNGWRLPKIWKTDKANETNNTVAEILAHVGSLANALELTAADIMLDLSKAFPDTEFYVHKATTSRFPTSCLVFPNAQGSVEPTRDLSREAGFHQITTNSTKLTVLWRKSNAASVAATCVSAIGLDSKAFQGCPMGDPHGYRMHMPSETCAKAVTDFLGCASKECDGQTASFAHVVCGKEADFFTRISWNMNDVLQENWKMDSRNAKQCIVIMGFWPEETNKTGEQGLVYHDFVEYTKVVNAYNLLQEQKAKQGCKAIMDGRHLLFQLFAIALCYCYSMTGQIMPLFGPIMQPSNSFGVYASFIATPLTSLSNRSGLTNLIPYALELHNGITSKFGINGSNIDELLARLANKKRSAVKVSTLHVRDMLTYVSRFAESAQGYIRKRHTFHKWEVNAELQKANAAKQAIVARFCKSEADDPHRLIEKLYETARKMATAGLSDEEFAAWMRLMQYLPMSLGQSNEICSAGLGLSAVEALAKRTKMLIAMNEFSKLLVEKDEEQVQRCAEKRRSDLKACLGG